MNPYINPVGCLLIFGRNDQLKHAETNLGQTDLGRFDLGPKLQTTYW